MADLPTVLHQGETVHLDAESANFGLLGLFVVGVEEGAPQHCLAGAGEPHRRRVVDENAWDVPQHCGDGALFHKILTDTAHLLQGDRLITVYSTAVKQYVWTY